MDYFGFLTEEKKNETLNKKRETIELFLNINFCVVCGAKIKDLCKICLECCNDGKDNI